MGFNEQYLSEMMEFLPQNFIEKVLADTEVDIINKSFTIESAVLFSDISGFTSMSEALSRIGKEGAEEMSRILNNYFENIEKIIRNHEGYIQKTAGDSATIFFIKKDNESKKELILKTVQCAFKIQELINNKFQYIETIADTYKLAMKIGISYGKVYFNTAGDIDYGIKPIILGKPIVDSTNAESVAKSGEIWITNSAVETIKDCVEFQEKGDYSKITKMTCEEQKYSYIKPIDVSKLSKETQITVTEKLRAFFPEEIYNRIILGQTGFLGEHRRITAIFVNFSGLDHSLGSVGQQIQEYIVTMSRIISKYGGRLQEYEGGDKGDKILIYFGAPISYENDAERALMCAYEIFEQGNKLDFITNQHIGVATGYVYAGVVGYKLYKSYTTIGDIVNVAARLMQYSMVNNHSIILESSTYEKTEKKFEFDELDSITVKNRVQPIQIYELKGKKHIEYKGYFEKKQVEDLPLVGRKKELDEFKQSIEKVKNAQGQIISLMGEAGIGKSRLTNEFLGYLSDAGIKGYGGDCLSYGANIPYLSWTEILKDFFQIDESTIKKDAVDMIENILREVDQNFVSKLPIVCNILGLEMEDNDLTKHLDAKLKKENFFSIVLESLKYKAKQDNGLFLIIEDAHWIDSISLELLNYVSRNISNEKIMIIIVHRPLGEPIDRNFKEIFDYSYHTHLNLSYLEPDETIELVNRKLNIDSITEDFKKLIVTRSQGNPFFIEEIVNSLIDNNYIKFNEDKNKYEMLKDLSLIDIPDTIQDIVLSRIDKLDESSKLTLKVASVIGRQFKFRVLCGIYPEEVKKSDTKIENLVNENLSKLRVLDLMRMDIPEPEIEYIFKHVITQEVSYASLLFSYRRELHERIAQYFEEHFPDRIDLIAHHYENTDNTKKKIEYFEKAAKLAENNYANQEAIEYYQKLIKLIDEEIDKTKIQLMEDYHKNISELWEKEKYDGIKQYIDKAKEIVQDVDDERIVSNYKSDLAKFYFKDSKYDEALKMFETSLEINQKNNNKERTSVDLFNIGVTYFEKMEYDKSREYIDKALSIAKEIKLDTLISSAEKALKELEGVK